MSIMSIINRILPCPPTTKQVAQTKLKDAQAQLNVLALQECDILVAQIHLKHRKSELTERISTLERLAQVGEPT